MDELVQYAELLMGFLQNQGPSLPVAHQRALASMLEQILGIIEQQGQQQAQGAPPAPPAAPNHPEMSEAMPSSNVEGFSYNGEDQKLYVRFLGEHPNRNGPVYEYDGVPPFIFHMFRSGSIPARTKGQNRWGRWWVGKKPSIGASLNALIKTQGYPYRRVG